MTNIFRTVFAREAAVISGLRTVAMLDYLQRSGVFIPTERRGSRGRGKGRQYNFKDLLILKAIAKLLDSGASVATLRQALEKFQKYNWSADPATFEDRAGSVRYLIANN